MTKKKKKAAAKKASAVKIVKITPVEPDKHIVELEVVGAPLPLPVETPLELEQAPKQNSMLKWLKTLW